MVLDTTGVTGVMVSYYFVCKRKLWFFSKDVDMEQIQPTVDLIVGKLLDAQNFKRERIRGIQIEDCVIDFISFGEEIIVHETKKSKKFEEAHIWQIKFYIHTLRKHGVEVSKGVIHYPRQMRKVEVNFSSEDGEKIERAIRGINSVVSLRSPPAPLNRPFCRNCSYYDLCYV